MEVKVSKNKDVYAECSKNCKNVIRLLDSMLDILKKNYKKVSK